MITKADLHSTVTCQEKLQIHFALYNQQLTSLEYKSKQPNNFGSALIIKNQFWNEFFGMIQIQKKKIKEESSH